MNPKHTWTWAGIAVVLFAFIFFFERHWQKPPPGPAPMLPGFKAAAVTRVIVQHAGQPEIRAERTNDSWTLVKSATLPAQPAAIEAMLGALEKIYPATRISARDLQDRPHAEEQFGVDNPQTTLVLLEGEHRNQINFGARTAPGDQVFVQVVGHEGIYVVDASVLELLPASASDWRDTSLLEWRKLAFDELVVSNAAGAMRFRRDVTNRQWLIREPLKTGADTRRIEEALERLRALRITQFVTDDPRADLETFGLQSPAFDITFRLGTNSVAALRFGKITTNAPPQIYVRRENSIATVPADPLAAWTKHFSYFRERHLFVPPADFTEIEVTGTNSFTLQRSNSNTWRIATEKFPVDTALVNAFVNTLASIEIPSPGGFVKDAAIEGDYARYGLTSAVRQISFKLPAPAGATNASVKQVSFGWPPGDTNDLVYARRSGEDSIFAISRADFQMLPTAAWQLREQRIWNFAPGDVVRLVAREGGSTREFVRAGTNAWALGPGTQGVVETDALNFIVQQLGELRATAWAARGDAARQERFGFSTNNLSVTIELKTGAKLEIQFGGLSPSKYPYALVTLDGEPWAFEFSTAVYQFMLAYLANPKS